MNDAIKGVITTMAVIVLIISAIYLSSPKDEAKLRIFCPPNNGYVDWNHPDQIEVFFWNYSNGFPMRATTEVLNFSEPLISEHTYHVGDQIGINYWVTSIRYGRGAATCYFKLEPINQLNEYFDLKPLLALNPTVGSQNEQNKTGDPKQ